LQLKSTSLASSIRAERILVAADGNLSSRLPTLREEPFLTWNLTKSAKKRSAGAMTGAEDEEGGDDNEEGVLLVTTITDVTGKVIW
jgi:hypothetical protein